MNSVAALLVALTSLALFVPGSHSPTGADSAIVLHVRDQAGRAVPRARVFVELNPYGSIRAVPPTVFSSQSVATGVTDDEGALRIERGNTRFATATILAEGLSPRMLRLWGSDRVEATSDRKADELVDEPSVIDVVLAPGARIVGRVTGAPEGAAVRALTTGWSLIDEARMRLDGWYPDADAAFVASIATDGTFAFDILPAAVVLRLDLVEGDQVKTCLSACIALNPGEVRRVNRTLGAGVALECIVRDERGAYVRGAQVRLVAPSYGGFSQGQDAWSAAWRRLTDASGRVVFDDVLPGRWTFVLERPLSFAQRRAGASWPEVKVTIDVGESCAPPIELTAFDVRTISGVVVDPDGAPIGGKVHVTRVDAGIHSSVSSMLECSAEGAFCSGPLAPGTYQVAAHRAWPHPDTFAPSEPLYAEAGNDALRLTLRRARSLDLRAIDGATREPADAYFSIGHGGRGWGPLQLSQVTPSRRIDCVPLDDAVLIVARTADGRVGTVRLAGSEASVPAPRGPLPVEVPVGIGGVLRVRYHGPVPSLRCEVTFDGVRLEKFEVISGGESRQTFPPGCGTLHWRLDPQMPNPAGVDGAGTRELRFFAGEETSVVIDH